MGTKSPYEREFRATQWIPRARAEVFAFFSDEKNLENITPPKLNFQVVNKSTDVIRQGTLIEYRLSLYGIPFRWHTLIDQWNPEEGFVDTQLKGPYKLWHHTHTFEDRLGGTLMTDVVRYQLPFAWATDLLVGWFVRRDVESIFAYRKKIITERFGGAPPGLQF